MTHIIGVQKTYILPDDCGLSHHDVKRFLERSGKEIYHSVFTPWCDACPTPSDRGIYHYNGTTVEFIVPLDSREKVILVAHSESRELGEQTLEKIAKSTMPQEPVLRI